MGVGWWFIGDLMVAQWDLMDFVVDFNGDLMEWNVIIGYSDNDIIVSGQKYIQS